MNWTSNYIMILLRESIEEGGGPAHSVHEDIAKSLTTD